MIRQSRYVASVLVCGSMFLSSCASIVSKSQYPVTINSTPSGAHVTVTDKSGHAIHNATTPTTVTLKSSSGYFQPASYTLNFDVNGKVIRTVPLKASMNGWYVGNIVFGGLIGIIIVDPLTGAMWSLSDNVNVDLNNKVASSSAEPRSLQIVQRNAIPKDWEGRLVAIN